MADAFPVELISFCEKLSAAITNAGRTNGWRVQPFGRQGLNTDVIVGQTILKVTTQGKPAPDGSGAVIRFDQGPNRAFQIRAGTGGLELADAAGAPITLDKFIDLVGEACDAPIKKIPELPTPLQRLCEQLATAVVSTGRENGWTVQGFGSRGFNTDVIVGTTIVKITTEGTPAPDGAGGVIRLRRPGFETGFTTRVAKDGKSVELEANGQAMPVQRFLETVAEALGCPLKVEQPLSPQLVRFCERFGSTVVKIGQDLGWDMSLFGKRGFNTDCAVGPNIVKVTTEVKPDGTDATIWIKSPAVQHSFHTKPGANGELELAQNGAAFPMDRLLKLLAAACGTPLEEEEPLPEPLSRLLEFLGSGMGSAGNANGWRVTQFGKRGLNADVAVGGTICKVTTTGKPAPDGSGATVKLARAGWEKLLTTRAARAGELELTEDGKPVSMERFVELLAEGVNARIASAAPLPPALNRFYEKLASTVATAGHDSGWKVSQFGSRGFNADLAMGANVIKVSTEGTAAPDGSGIAVRVKRPNFDKSYTTRLGKNSELELVDGGGTAIKMEQLVGVLKEAGKF